MIEYPLSLLSRKGVTLEKQGRERKIIEEKIRVVK